MIKKAIFGLILVGGLVGAVLLSLTGSGSATGQDRFSSFLDKKDVTILVTDSGLGGLSILADAVRKIREFQSFRTARFVFFNALFSNEGGYNSLSSRGEKIRIFDSALQSMHERFSPDLIIVGCNTLSVLYDETSFSRTVQIPVLGIVDEGIKLISSQLRNHPESIVLIFATQTTLAEGKHKNGLIKKGFLPGRIKEQACPDLVPYIERGVDSPETEMLIFAYVDEALQKIPNHRSSLLVSLNCTHYGYSLDLWRKAFQSQGITPLAYLNPNGSLNDFLLDPDLKNRYGDTTVTVEVVSMVEISEERAASIGKVLESLSPESAKALREYRLDPQLFTWDQRLR